MRIKKLINYTAMCKGVVYFVAGFATAQSKKLHCDRLVQNKSSSLSEALKKSLQIISLVYLSSQNQVGIDQRAKTAVAMAPYKIIKQGYIMKEPPASKRGLRRVSD